MEAVHVLNLASAHNSLLTAVVGRHNILKHLQKALHYFDICEGMEKPNPNPNPKYLSITLNLIGGTPLL